MLSATTILPTVLVSLLHFFMYFHVIIWQHGISTRDTTLVAPFRIATITIFRATLCKTPTHRRRRKRKSRWLKRGRALHRQASVHFTFSATIIPCPSIAHKLEFGATLVVPVRGASHHAQKEQKVEKLVLLLRFIGPVRFVVLWDVRQTTSSRVGITIIIIGLYRNRIGSGLSCRRWRGSNRRSNRWRRCRSLRRIILHAGTRVHIVEIPRRLGDLPIAIELAKGRERACPATAICNIGT